MLTRQTFYVLTVHYYPHAVEEGVLPVEVIAYADADQPGRYRSHEFAFQHPPTADDFKAVVALLPWAQHAWGKTLVPTLDHNDWPYIGMGKKAADVSLTNAQGQQVGRLEVRKNETWLNAQYPNNIYVSHALRDRLTNGYKGEAREQVRAYIDRHELRIIGMVVAWSRANDGLWPGEEEVAAEVRKIIKEWKATRQPAAV